MAIDARDLQNGSKCSYRPPPAQETCERLLKSTFNMGAHPTGQSISFAVQGR